MKNFKQTGDVFENARQMIALIEQDIAKHQDNRKKDVGDKVLVWDGSGNCDKNTGEDRHGIDELFKKEAIVIQTNCKFEHKSNYSANTRILDLLLLFPTGEEVYCSSDFVKRTDSYLV